MTPGFDVAGPEHSFQSFFVLLFMFYLAFLFLLLALRYFSVFGFSKGNPCCLGSQLGTESEKDETLFDSFFFLI